MEGDHRVVYRDRRRRICGFVGKVLKCLRIERRKIGERRADWLRCSAWSSIYAPNRTRLVPF